MKTNLKAGTQSADSFTRFMRSLGADNDRRSMLGLLLALALIAAWSIWLFRARVTVYEVTTEARLEAEQAGYTIESNVAGRLVTTRLALGQQVKAGDVLAELDTDEQQHKLDEENARLSSITPQVEALANQVAAEQQAIEDARQANSVALQEARSRVEEAESSAQFSDEEARRLQALYREGIIAEMEALRARSRAKSQLASVESLKHATMRIEREQRTQETERRVRIDKLLREKTELQAQKSSSAATITRLQNDIERRTIRAPVAGQLGEITTSKSGAVLREGDKLGTVLPSGGLKIVAEFPPSALGRINTGQVARMRLTSFPWTQYGSLVARVTKVAGEVRDGKIRVELSLEAPASQSIPVQHGLPGTVEIEVESVSPATLLLRAVKFFNKPAAKENQNIRSGG